jgi:hypothetical protein
VAVIAPSQLRKFPFSNFQTLKTIENFVFIYRTIKHCKELWRVEDRVHSGRLKSVRAEAAIKTVWEQIREKSLWKQNIVSLKLNVSTQSSCASSGMIYT